MEKWLDIGEALFAFVAAVFWFLSAYGSLPPMVMYWHHAPESDPLYVTSSFQY
jgi:hypothetical protein